MFQTARFVPRQLRWEENQQDEPIPVRHALRLLELLVSLRFGQRASLLDPPVRAEKNGARVLSVRLCTDDVQQWLLSLDDVLW